MFKRKQTRAIQKFIYSVFKQFWQLTRTASRKLSRWLVRNLLNKDRSGRRYAGAKAGFILPTVTLLLLVVALVIAAILFRTGSRTNQVILQRKEQIIYNAATPAIERAKAKIEFLFRQDDRLPAGVPSEFVINNMLLNNGSNGLAARPNFPYTLNDETRLDINGGGVDNAWSYRADLNNDGTLDATIVYSILLMSRQTDANGNVISGGVKLEDSNEQLKAQNLVVRNGPINTTEPARNQCPNLNLQPDAGWYPISTSSLKKTFQVTAVAISDSQRDDTNGNTRAITTLEFQQERQVDKGNKWGAWYRYDLDLFPGSAFNWNGAMHTEGSLMVGYTSGDNNFTAYLISSPFSCVYSLDASEITVANLSADATTGQPAFKGQFVAGRIANTGDTTGTSRFHLHGPPRISDANANEIKFTDSTDSVQSGGILATILDPVALFTKDISKNLNTGLQENANFTTSALSTRLGRQSETAPYVDDTYRADDRYGPKPRYDTIQLGSNGSGRYNGDRITGQPKLTNNTVDRTNDPDLKNLGLDGYWERRAWGDGLRVIVGQRLELGNTYGWTSNDPLYPPDGSTSTPPQSSISHEARQRRTLRDNLAAVQATAVYHHNNPNNPTGNAGDFPLACLATTVHPGTGGTITDSTTAKSLNFNLSPYTYNNGAGTQQLYSNFFTGEGTNGWEYTPPPNNFLSDVNWQNALNNLANFAGDVDGAFPPRQEGGRIHPDPYLTMWGNFSNLQRALDPSRRTNPLSIADNSYIQTAACSLGMLAYNINHFQNFTYNSSTTYNGNQVPAALTNLATALQTADSSWPTGLPRTLDNYIARLSGTDRNLAGIVHLKEQISRDRRYGFANSPTRSSSTPAAPFAYTIKYRPQSSPSVFTPFSFGGINYSQDQTIALKCDISGATGNRFFGINNTGIDGFNGAGSPNIQAQEEAFLRLALSLCSDQPKYPSLYYLFPDNTADSNVDNHNRVGTGNHTQPPTEPYISNTGTITAPLNGGNFRAVNPATLVASGFRPRQVSDWQLPVSNANPSTTPASSPYLITAPDTNRYLVSFLDTAIYDGREAMVSRLLNIDLDLLRKKALGSTTLPDRTTVTETLLPASGVVYAFREDAVREDAIARQSGSAMNATSFAANQQNDPTLESNGLSRKPVDFYPDPDRRPFGFRLRNGADLRRSPGGSPNNAITRGLTLISDNPVYIHGNFNLHSSNGTIGSVLEEFDTPLNSSWTNFYSRNNLNANFAQPTTDTWRPSEILADAVGILSETDGTNGFVDGDIARGIRGIDRHSFRGMNRPNNSNTNLAWVRENGLVPSDQNTATLPIKISRNGNPFYCNGSPDPTSRLCSSTRELSGSGDYLQFTDNKRPDINVANPTTANATLVSGIVPFQANQPNGGFHNFPRLLENWFNNGSSRRLSIAGSFVQLNFSTYATGLFDQEAWESGTPSSTGVNNLFYDAPDRNWGYDVGLQLAPAGPLAQRFVTPGLIRSEFYRELSASDPYICQLRRSANDRTASRDCTP